jgi:hypothetical protein
VPKTVKPIIVLAEIEPTTGNWQPIGLPDCTSLTQAVKLLKEAIAANPKGKVRKYRIVRVLLETTPTVKIKETVTL